MTSRAFRRHAKAAPRPTSSSGFGRSSRQRPANGPWTVSKVAQRAAADIGLELQELPQPSFLPPLIGDTIPFLLDWEKYFKERTQQLGPVFRTHILGSPLVCICDAKMGKEFAEKHDVKDMDSEASPVLVRALDFGGQGSPAFNLMLQQRDFKQFSKFKRGVFMEAFGPSYMPSAYPTIEAIFRERFDAAVADGGAAAAVDITDVLHAATMQVIYARVVGAQPTYGHVRPIFEAMRAFSGGLQHLLLPDFLNPTLRQFEAAKRTLTELLMAEVDIVRAQFEAVQRGERPPPPDERTSAFIWRMLEAEAAAGTSATAQDWASNVVIAFLAGHETTRWSSVALTMFVMQHEGVLGTLRAEMHAAAAEFGPEYMSSRAAAAKMPYTEACIHETMRILTGAKKFGGSLAALSRRVPREALACGGYRIPAGVRTMLVAPYMIHAEEKFQLDGDTFDMAFRPERFVEDGHLVKPEAFTAFGVGPRLCPGQALAMTEMRALLKLMAMDGLRVHFKDPTSKWEVQGLTPSPRNGKCTMHFDADAASAPVAAAQ